MNKIIILSMLAATYGLYAEEKPKFHFDECSGSGTFEQQINAYGGDFEKTVLVGKIPEGIKGLHVELTSDKDVDIRLYGANNDKIVHWPHGILKKNSLETKPYKNVPITYSGYDGINGDKGHEFIDINGTTPTDITMKAFGYQSGYATVNYSWTGKEGCEEGKGTGHFEQDIPNKDIALVGSIPKDIENLEVNLTSDKDIDIQLYGEDGTAIIQWPGGLLDGSKKQTIDYHNMHIEWSGYDGLNGYKGHEYIKLTGKTTEKITMKVYGYQAGSASVDYSWGNNENNHSCITKEELRTKIRNNEDVTHANVSCITDMRGLFNTSNILESLNNDFNQDISNWDVSNVTDMSEMFAGAKSFNQPIGNWDVSNVTNMAAMFAGAKSFNQPIGNWDVSNLTFTFLMFYKAESFNQPLANWDVSNIHNMMLMFSGAKSFNQPISNWNVSKVTKYSGFSTSSALQESYKPHFNH